jgi:outer membrane protein insertion porin family
VDVDTVPVPGSDDLVDINYKVKERAPGSVQFGVGYSQSQGILLNASIVHSNFLGTGDRVALTANTSVIAKSLSLSFTDPYFTADGISQTISLSYRKASNIIRYSTGFDYNIASAGVSYGIPLSEFTQLRLGGAVSQTAIRTFPGSTSNELLAFVLKNGTNFTEFEAETGIARDTRNRTFFASRGALDSLNVNIEVPLSDVTYYTARFQHEQYFALPLRFFIEFNGNAGYIAGYGGAKSGVPPFDNYFGGGPGSVRGFKEGYLGPKDFPFENPFGGHLLTTAQTTLVIPTPLGTDNKSTRFGLFFDAGNVFASAEQFSFGEIRQSAGLSVQYFTPILGLLSLSFAEPVKSKTGDNIEHFQINFGQAF